MAYKLMLHEDRVIRFLRDYEGLSREGRIRLFTHLHSQLRVHADHFRERPEDRIENSDFFWYRFVMRDTAGDGRVRMFSFIVNDAAAKFGVLQLEYVEISKGPERGN